MENPPKVNRTMPYHAVEKRHKKPWWVLGIVNTGSYGCKETLFVAWGAGPDGPQPSARRECFRKFVSRVRNVHHNLNRPLQGPGSVQVLKRWKIASDYLLSRADNTFQCLEVLKIKIKLCKHVHFHNTISVSHHQVRKSSTHACGLHAHLNTWTKHRTYII